MLPDENKSKDKKNCVLNIKNSYQGGKNGLTVTLYVKFVLLDYLRFTLLCRKTNECVLELQIQYCKHNTNVINTNSKLSNVFK